MADKIRFNEAEHASEYEPTDSDDDLSEEEKEILKNVMNKNNRREEEDNKQQVLEFADSDDDDDDDDNEEDAEDDDDDEKMDDSDIEGAGKNDGDDNIPDAMDWGDKTRNYYNTDFVDQDYDTYNQQEEEMAQQEEEEAKNIQQRLLKQMNEADFMLDAELIKAAEMTTLSDEATKIKSDLSGLTKREQQRLFQEDAPEFEGLIKNFCTYLTEQKEIVNPVLEYVEAKNLPLIPAFKFARVHQQLVLSYCTNVLFYLLLKAKRMNIKSHPVTKKLLHLQLLLKELKEKYEEIIKPQLQALLERIVAGVEFEIQEIPELVLNKKKKSKKTNNTTDDGSSQAAATSQKMDMESSSDDDEDDDEEEDIETETETTENAVTDERRGITYQIAKNKGLMPHRKKELRNPRVKHRTKFRKALIRRKGAVRTVRTETKRYGGETSGIKASVSKSIKFKV